MEIRKRENQKIKIQSLGMKIINPQIAAKMAAINTAPAAMSLDFPAKG